MAFKNQRAEYIDTIGKNELTYEGANAIVNWVYRSLKNSYERETFSLNHATLFPEIEYISEYLKIKYSQQEKDFYQIHNNHYIVSPRVRTASGIFMPQLLLALSANQSYPLGIVQNKDNTYPVIL